jgi:hypothetical protein
MLCKHFSIPVAEWIHFCRRNETKIKFVKFQENEMIFEHLQNYGVKLRRNEIICLKYFQLKLHGMVVEEVVHSANEICNVCFHPLMLNVCLHSKFHTLCVWINKARSCLLLIIHSCINPAK